MKKNYIDIDLSSFANPHPISGDITLLTLEDVVKNNLKNLILTNFFEKYGSPRYGGNVKRYLFTKINVLEKLVIETDLLEQITKHEPRVSDVKVEVDLQVEQQTISLDIWYTIISISEEQFLNITLNRVR